MRVQKSATILLCLFLDFMLFFTLFGKDIYNTTLPKVIVETVTRKSFPVTIETPEGSFETKRTAYAVPEKAVTDGMVFILGEGIGGEAYVLRQVIKAGEIKDGWIEVCEGLGGKDKIIHASDRTVLDNQKVIVLSEPDETIRLYMEGTKEEKEAFKKNCKRNNIRTTVLFIIIMITGNLVLHKIIPKKLRFLFPVLTVILFLAVCFHCRNNLYL